MQFNEYNVHIELLEHMLGTIPKNPDVYTAHVRTQIEEKHPDRTAGEDEQVVLNISGDESAEDIAKRGWTTFYTDEHGRPVLFDYQFKGMIKNAGNVLKQQLKVANLKSHIENTLFIEPRMFVMAEKVDGYLERPLRAMTMQGPRVTVVRSDYIAAGTTMDWVIKILEGSKVTEDVLKECLAYGEYVGLLQWRNGGYGRFRYELR